MRKRGGLNHENQALSYFHVNTPRPYQPLTTSCIQRFSTFDTTFKHLRSFRLPLTTIKLSSIIILLINKFIFASRCLLNYVLRCLPGYSVLLEESADFSKEFIRDMLHGKGRITTYRINLYRSISLMDYFA